MHFSIASTTNVHTNTTQSSVHSRHANAHACNGLVLYTVCACSATWYVHAVYGMCMQCDLVCACVQWTRPVYGMCMQCDLVCKVDAGVCVYTL